MAGYVPEAMHLLRDYEVRVTAHRLDPQLDLGWSGRGSTEETTVSVGGRGGHSASGAPVRPISGLEVVPVELDAEA